MREMRRPGERDTVIEQEPAIAEAEGGHGYGQVLPNTLPQDHIHRRVAGEGVGRSHITRQQVATLNSSHRMLLMR